MREFGDRVVEQPGRRQTARWIEDDIAAPAFRCRAGFETRDDVSERLSAAPVAEPASDISMGISVFLRSALKCPL